MTREIKELVFQPIIVIKECSDRFQKKEKNKLKPIKKTWYDWLIN